MSWLSYFGTVLDRADEHGAVPMGEVPIGWAALAISGALLLGAHSLRLWTGAVSWFGFQHAEVRAAAEVPNAFLNDVQGFVTTGNLRNGFGLGLPLIALPGQEVVVRYDLEAKTGEPDSVGARVHVSCLCNADDNWRMFRIEGPGSGEFVVPVRHASIYSIRLRQSRSIGGVSQGNYYWGVRRVRDEG